MARQSKKCAYVIRPLNGNVIWGLVTYFNKIKYEQHTDVGSFFVYNLKNVCYEIKSLTKMRKKKSHKIKEA